MGIHCTYVAPPFHLWPMPACNFLMCVYCEGYIHCLEGEECPNRNFKGDEPRGPLHKLEEEVQVAKMLRSALLTVLKREMRCNVFWCSERRRSKLTRSCILLLR